MKKVFSGAGHIVLAVFTVAIILFMALMNYQTLGRVFPGDPMQQVWGMVLFTGGTLSWFAIFLLASRGFQRPIAMVMFGISLVGEVFYAAADVLQGGQSWVEVDASFGTYVIYSFIGLTFFHGFALYLHFFTKPEVWAAIDIEAIEDDIKDKAQVRAGELINKRVEGMADHLAGRVANTVYANLRLPMAEATVIDAVAQDMNQVNDLRPAQVATVTAKKEGWFGKIFRPWQQAAQPTSRFSDAEVERLARAWADYQFGKQPPTPSTVSSGGYTLEKLLSALGRNTDDVRMQMAEYGLDQDADHAFDTMTQYGLLPEDLERDNFKQLHQELFALAPEDASAADANFRS